MPIYAKVSRYNGRQFLTSHGFKTSCKGIRWRKLVTNLWPSAPPEKSNCLKRSVYAVGGYTQSLKIYNMPLIAKIGE